MANATFSLKDGLGSIDMSFRNDAGLDRKTVLGAIGSVLPGESPSASIINCIVNADTAPKGIVWDTVAIYDDFGIPSIMHRFRKVRNCDLFAGGSTKTHSAFVIGGEEYDEIYISVYPNCNINGRPYSLPYQEPWTNISQDDFAKACFAKGEGWHCMTAAEWGLLANISKKNGTLPHGNTDDGVYHANRSEKGAKISGSCKTLTGSGPATWTHDHTMTGVHDLCGNNDEFCRGLRILDGKIQIAENNDAALPDCDLSPSGSDWTPLADDTGNQIFGGYKDGRAVITAYGRIDGYSGCRWSNALVDTTSEKMKELALYAGEPNAYIWIDGTDGEYILLRGGGWRSGGSAGVFDVSLDSPRSNVYWAVGGRSAFFKKH